MACRAGGCYNKATKHPHCGNKSCCLDVIFDHYSCTGLHSFAVCKICNDGDVVNDRLEIHVMTHNNSNTGCAGPTLIRIGDAKRMAIDVIEMGRRIQQIYCLEIDYFDCRRQSSPSAVAAMLQQPYSTRSAVWESFLDSFEITF